MHIARMKRKHFNLNLAPGLHSATDSTGKIRGVLCLMIMHAIYEYASLSVRMSFVRPYTHAFMQTYVHIPHKSSVCVVVDAESINCEL